MTIESNDPNDVLNELLAMLWTGQLDTSSNNDPVAKARLACEITRTSALLEIGKELRKLRRLLEKPTPAAVAGDAEGGPTNP